MSSFGLIGKVFTNGDIVGFFIVDENDRQSLISKEKTLQLAESGYIANWTVVKDADGERHLYSDDVDISNIPTMTKDSIEKVTVTKRVMKDGQTFGYVCIDETGASKNCTVNKLWELAKAGKVDGVTAYQKDGSRVLYSKDHIFDSLPVINMK